MIDDEAEIMNPEEAVADVPTDENGYVVGALTWADLEELRPLVEGLSLEEMTELAATLTSYSGG